MERVARFDEPAPFVQLKFGWTEPEGIAGFGPLLDNRRALALIELEHHIGDKAHHLALRFLEHHIYIAPLHLGPFGLLGHTGSGTVALKGLMQNRDNHDGRVATTGGKLGKCLEHKQITRIAGAVDVGEVLTKLIDNQHHAGILAIGHHRSGELAEQGSDFFGG